MLDGGQASMEGKGTEKNNIIFEGSPISLRENKSCKSFSWWIYKGRAFNFAFRRHGLYPYSNYKHGMGGI